MTKKKILAIIFALVICVSLTACCNHSTANNSVVNYSPVNETVAKGTFVVVSQGKIPNTDIYQYIFYDPETLVMYSQTWRMESNNYGPGAAAGGMTCLYNADGTPKLYSP